MKAGGEEKNFLSVGEILPWLQHWYDLKDRTVRHDALEMELQKIYDSEINITVQTGDKQILVALGNEFTGFQAELLFGRTAGRWLTERLRSRLLR